MINPKSELTPFLSRMEPLLREMLDRLGATEFRPDPIGGLKYSRATSIISSAYKRHGQLLGRAILERLKDCSRFQVWTEESLKLSNESARELARGLPIEAYRTIRLAYGDRETSIPVDIMVHEPGRRLITAYNVKRGNGSFDAGKRRLIVGELLRTQMVLASYARSLGLEVDEARARIVFYYGLRSVPEPYSLVAAELDDHFEFPVIEAVETVNDLFRDGLHAMIDSTPGLA
jgi:hypothetical protein